MVNFWGRLERLAQEHNVLRHPFYERWSRGGLTQGELAHYSGQYRYAVIALAMATALAAQSAEAKDDAPALLAHAAEEATHIMLWDQFLEQVEGELWAEPTAETRDCVAAWLGETSRPLIEALVALYAIESAQPAISATKQTGLQEHYGIASSPYFELHRRRDIEHAAEMRDLIDKRLAEADEESLLGTASDVLRANWRLLDGVDAYAPEGGGSLAALPLPPRDQISRAITQ